MALKDALIALSLLLPAYSPLQGQGGAAVLTVGERPASRWVTLGTRGGPMASPTRSQPANLLLHQGHAYPADAGDGVTGQLVKAGVSVNEIDAVFISHLHVDHTAGAPNVLKVYGPPGIKALLEGLIASMAPGTTAGYGVPGSAEANLRDQVEITELRDRASFTLAGANVVARENAHYSFSPGSELERNLESLAFRYDLPDRSIVFTGDTGRSVAVEELAKGADILVAEMMDVEHTIANVRRDAPALDPRAAAAMERHLRAHHLLPVDVGVLAHRAGVGAVAVTHFVGRETGDPQHFGYLRQIGEHYTGPVIVADDLDGV